ncbi:MAG TPA: hypothetical protein VH062_02105 [Polyangiaceae bacterium]|jgi:hypothetical protein|nr:hypothetical protein [Polyangiaceae bacterium]
MIDAAFINESTSLSSGELLEIATVCAKQQREHVAPAWGWPTPTIEFLPSPRFVLPGMRIVKARDLSDVAGAGAYHDKDERGVPVSYVFVGTLTQAGEAPSVGFSHEVSEMAGNPNTALWVPGPDGYDVARELVDAVEGDSYPIDGILVSNFLLPNFFIVGAPPPYDHMGLVKQPFETRPRGYQIRRDRKTGEVDQVFGELRERWRIDAKSRPGTRAYQLVKTSA